MAGREVTALDGRRWQVRRRWLPRPLPRWRGGLRRRGGGGGDWSGAFDWVDVGPLDDLPSAIAMVLLLALAAAVLVVFVVPALVFTAELVVGLAVALVAIAGRLLLGRPWLVEARSGDDRLEWRVRGWRASGQAVEEVAEALQRGDRAPQPADAELPAARA